MNKLKVEKEIWLRENPKPWDEEIEKEYHRIFSTKVERWLDSGMGECRLRNREAREVVVASMQHGEVERYELHCFAIMPNHVHLLFTPSKGWTLETIVGSWKKYTARAINGMESRGGSFWAKSYFDRLIRDPGHLANVIRYIHRNPMKAGLSDQESLVWESDRVKALNLKGLE